MNIKVVSAGVALAMILAAGWFMTRFGHETEPSFKTAQATRGDLQILIAAAGSLTPKETVDVGAQVSGQLEVLLVEAGDEVTKGQLLAQIDATLAENQVEADRAQLKESGANYAQQEAQVELAQSELDRATILRAQDAISQAEFETTQSSLKIAKAQLVQLSAQIERQNSTLKSDLAELEYTNIYAPITGTVTSLSASEGQTLNANQSAPTILTIADLSIMTVEADVSEADVLQVMPGQNAYFTTLGDSETRWETTVRQILPEPEVVNDVVLYKALLDIENPDRVLRSSMTTQVFFIVDQALDAVTVPLAALQSLPARKERPETSTGDIALSSTQKPDSPALASLAFADMRPRHSKPEGDPQMVLVITNDADAPRPRRVQVGLQTRNSAQILSGLDVGETVVVGQQTPPARDASARGNTNRPGGPGPRPRF